LTVEELIRELKELDPAAVVLIEGDVSDDEVTTVEVVSAHGTRTVILCSD